jgi:hypothetical protein
VTVKISTTDFSNFGNQTFQLTFNDTRNFEQTTGLTTTFIVEFNTCKLVVTKPINAAYTVGTTTASQTIVSNETKTCNYAVTCSLGASAPAWTSISGCTVSWSTSDTTLEITSYTVPISIDYASSPSSQNYSTSFKINLVPNMNVFKGSTVTLSPSPTPAPNTAQLQSFWDGFLPSGSPTNSWGNCTGAASTVSITLTSSTTVVGRTILTTLSSDQTTGTSLSLSLNGTTQL